MKEKSREKSVRHEDSNKIAIVLNSSHQHKILESFNKVKIRLSEINKHVSDGINKDFENSKKPQQIRS